MSKLAVVGDHVICGFAGEIAGTVTEINVVDGRQVATVLEEATERFKAELAYWNLDEIVVTPLYTVARCPQCDFVFPARVNTSPKSDT